mgnify:CR=1 FL=1
MIHSNGRKKIRTKMKIGTTTSESAPVGFSLFGLQESTERRQGRNTDGLRGMFRRVRYFKTSHRLRKLTLSLGEAVGRYRLPRHEGGKDSSRYSESGSGSLSRLRRGEIRTGFGAMAFFAAVGVWQTFGRRGVVEGGTGINVSFRVHVFDLSPGAMAAAGACR